MDLATIARIFDETAYVRTSGTAAEKKCAEYIQAACTSFGGNAFLEPFSVDMSTIHSASLTINGKQIPCKGYLCAGSHQVEAPLFYLTDNCTYSLEQCAGKIVMIDGYLRYWRYQDLLKYGAVGFITYDGNINYADNNIDQRELRKFVSNGNLLPGVNINAKDAIEIIAQGGGIASITLQQEMYSSDSHNVILDLPGERPEYIVLTAHYDTTSLSQGAYDNMSGVIGLLSMAESYITKPHKYGLRFIWCGSEERGLLGSKAYCAAHKDQLENIVLNINLDMIGCIMGTFHVRCTCEEKAVGYAQYLASELGFGCSVLQGVSSSDSSVFADNNVPAITFFRSAPANVGTIHDSYDTKALMSPQQMQKDIAFIEAFLDRVVNAFNCPVSREIPDNMREKLDEYFFRKKPKNT